MKNSGITNVTRILTAVWLLCAVTLLACSSAQPEEQVSPDKKAVPAGKELEDKSPAAERELSEESTASDGEEKSVESDTTVAEEGLVKSITTIVGQRGGRVDWGSNNLIAHSRFGEDGYYDLWIMNPDGSEARCLTCDNPEIAQLHNGQPAWHPSGKYIVFQSQDPSLPHTRLDDNLQTQPGFGKHNNLWLTDPGGEHFYQLTSIKQNMAILHAHFSHDGTKLTWAEKVGYGASDWAIMIADFVETPEPHLVNITRYQPLGKVWYETHAFSPDDEKVLFTAGTGAEAWYGFDIWEMEISTQEVKQLTSNPEIWDEHAHYSPDGTKIVWASSRGYPYDFEAKAFEKVAGSLKLDYWIMDADGSNKQRLTCFNEPGYAEYTGYQAIVADSNWSPDGKKIVATVLSGRSREDAMIVVIELNETVYGGGQAGSGEDRLTYVAGDLELLRPGGRYPKWCPKNNLIAFDAAVDGNYEIFTMKPDGSEVNCLTCGKQELSSGHKGQPYWHPGGEHIVFSAENTEYPRWKPNDMTVVPGISGRNNDVWIMTSDGSKFWRITNNTENGGVIRPSFSPDGKVLYWNEEWSLEKYPGRGSLWSVKNSPLGEKWGLWQMKLADISFDEDGPVVTNIRTVNINKLYPGKVLLEGQGIQPDNEHLIFSAADITETEGYVRWGWPPEDVYGLAHWGDLYITDLEGGSLQRLTNTPYKHDENPEYSPDGCLIAWTRARGAVGDNAEIYIMNSDGSGITQLTHFHEAGYPEYNPKSRASGELDWSPDGSHIIFSFDAGWDMSYPSQKTNIYVLTLRQKEDTSAERPVNSITTILDRQAKTVDWHHKTNRIAFGKWGMDWYVDVYIMNPDGSKQECLTCNKPHCPQKHNGNPAWHPSGNYIVFTAEKEANPKEYAQWAIPGSGFNCDLWVMTGDGKKFYQLTDYPLHTRSVIHPHFSHDGKKLFWAERLGKSEGSSWGEWALRVADFAIGADGPGLRNIKTYQPGKNHYFYESHDFSPDDSKILFCANPEGQSDVGFDIYDMNLRTGELVNFTRSPDDWDELAQYSPDGQKIIWISSTGFDIDFKSIEGYEWMRYLKTELWIMDADGSNKQGLTYFNEPGYPEYMGGTRCIVSDTSWSPDGKRIVALVAYEGEGFAGLKSKLVIIELE